MDATPKYHVVEDTNKYGATIYLVARVDGTPSGYGTGQDSRIAHTSYPAAELADFHCAFVNATPDHYRIERDTHRANSMRAGRQFWRITSMINGDPIDLRQTWDDGNEVKGNWPEGTRPVDVLIALALRHADGVEARIAKHAEGQAVAAAEATVREAREAQLSQLRKDKGELATPRQVDFILSLLDRREHTGEGGGFFMGPKDRAGIEELSKSQASAYIRSLKGDY